MIQLIPEKYQRPLLSAIANGNIDSIKNIIEQNGLEVNIYNNHSFSPIIMDVLTSFGIKNENDRLKILQFFLDRGADPNLNCKSGYNSLHIAVQQDKLIQSLDLFLDFRGDVNSVDKNGATVAYWAIQGFPWRTEGRLRQQHLRVVEKIMLLGADLDFKNKFGVAPRDWLDRSPEDLQQLVQKCEKLNPDYKKGFTIQPDFPTNNQFPDIVKHIRTNLIPVRGRAKTLEGEMLRGLDILQDEAYRNGNANYSKTHEGFAKFILDNLTTFTKTSAADIEKITHAARKLMNAEEPYLEDDVYDYLTDQICIFHQKINNDEFEMPKKKWWRFWKYT